MNINAIVVDDSHLARISLISDLEEFCPEINIIGEAEDVISAAKVIKVSKPQLIFLDIEMGSHNGFDLLEIIEDKNIAVIFVTGSRDFAINAFQVKATDYLLKPIDPDLLRKAIEKVKAQFNIKESKTNKISLHTSEEVRWVAQEDILRLQSDGNYTKIYFKDQSKLIVAKTLKEYERTLDQKIFIRVHQSHIINIDYVKSFIKSEGGYILMTNNDQIPISVRRRSQVLQILENQ